MRIAATILDQLGGNQFQTMTGARNFVPGSDYLQFDMPRGMAKFDGKTINKVRITLEPTDTYKIEMWKFQRLELIPVTTRSGIYCDTLRDCFSKMTGLDMKL
jgi:hypothetical protein